MAAIFIVITPRNRKLQLFEVIVNRSLTSNASLSKAKVVFCVFAIRNQKLRTAVTFDCEELSRYPDVSDVSDVSDMSDVSDDRE